MDAIKVTGQLDFRKGDVGLPWRGPVAETPHRYCRARGLHPRSEKAHTLLPTAKKRETLLDAGAGGRRKRKAREEAVREKRQARGGETPTEREL